MRSLALPPAQKILVVLPAAQPDHLCIVLNHNVRQRKTLFGFTSIKTNTLSLGSASALSFSSISIARRHHRSRLSPLPPQVPLPLPLAHVVVVDLRCQLPPLKTTQINDGCPFMLLLPLSLSAAAPPPFAVII
jgi:hypothetical protein